MQGFKTVAYGIAVGLIGFFSTPEMTQFIAEHFAWATTAVGTGIAILRVFTSSPIFKKE